MKPLTPPPQHAYRSRHEPPAAPGRSKGKSWILPGDRELIPIGIILWLGALAQVVHVAAQGAEFGALATFALVCVLGIPWLFWRSRTQRERG